MTLPDKLWLLTNAKSGSNSEAALDELQGHCGTAGLAIERTIRFPDEDIPSGAELDAAGIECLAIFTGDGTLNAAITGLYGWSGAVLVLPGGTMNLLSIRMHGEAELATIIERYQRGAMRRWRPQVARCEAGDALAGLLIGPGTAWASVREAMRDADVAETASKAGEALSATTEGPRVRCSEPPLGRREGYPLLEMTPSHRGMQTAGYHADTPLELARQGMALLRRSFREGPHDLLGLVDRLVVENCDGEPLGILIDGEPASIGASAEFTLAPCEVDLLASQHGY
ncbi:MAG: diacylglycerol kinase [Alphaproteobacteria bacterium]|nr:diacylglycerol kinase [Alphaproteobacteria bacterium]